MEVIASIQIKMDIELSNLDTEAFTIWHNK